MSVRQIILTSSAVRDRLRGSGAGHTARSLDPARRQAGVAIILSGCETAPHLCFLRRVERQGDRWSGDVAFPGGWAQPDDGMLTMTAVRETLEEVGLDLTRAEHLGDLPTSPIAPAGRWRLGAIGASVFRIAGEPPPLTCCPREVAEAFWVPSAHLVDPVHTATVEYAGGSLPGIAYGRHVIWGLTHRILLQFFALLEIHETHP